MAKTKRKTGKKVNEFSQQLENVFLAGLGVLANAQKMSSDTFETLVKDGKTFRASAEKKADKVIKEVRSDVRELSEETQERADGLFDRVRDRAKFGRLQKAFDKRVADAMDSMNVPSKNDIAKINRKLNAIQKTLKAQGKEALAKKGTTTRRATATSKRATAAKPASARQVADQARSKAA